MGSYQTKKFTGEFWTGQIYFDPNCDSNDLRVYNISDAELHSALAYFINPYEAIQNVWMFKCKMYDWQLSHLYLYHAFIVVETNGFFWSLEKNSTGITIQRSKWIEFVRDRYRRRNRRKLHQIHVGRSRARMMDLVRLLYEKSELNRRYNGWSENCQIFADRVFNEIVEPHFAIVH